MRLKLRVWAAELAFISNVSVFVSKGGFSLCHTRRKGFPGDHMWRVAHGEAEERSMTGRSELYEIAKMEWECGNWKLVFDLIYFSR